MIGNPRAFLFSLQTKLVLVLTSVIMLAILIAGAVFAVRDRDDRREAALNRVAAASPAIYQQTFQAFLTSRQVAGAFDDSLDELAASQAVRILILGPKSTIIYDTSAQLGGEALAVPESRFEDIQRGFVAWEPPEDFPEQNVTLVAASSRFTFGPGREIPFRVVLAVRSDTIADSWLDVLPSLGLAALVAVPLSALAGMVLARQVAHPVRRLTAASEAMAHGDFDQRVEVDRDDEIGRLARSFSAMAQRVGERDTQMHALLANVSHDLKTPMTSITGYAQSLGDGTADACDTERIANVIREEAEQVNRLLGDLLYLAEIDAGQVLPRREDASLPGLLSRCLRRIESATRERGIDITIDVDPGAVLGGVDAEKIQRAFTNVLDNAAKFTPDGGAITVRSMREEQPGAAMTLVEIENTSAPIPDDDLPRIFERFFRGDRSRATSGGSGLGLAIAKELVELHGGRISASSGPNSVTVSIRLPG